MQRPHSGDSHILIQVRDRSGPVYNKSSRNRAGAGAAGPTGDDSPYQAPGRVVREPGVKWAMQSRDIGS